MRVETRIRGVVAADNLREFVTRRLHFTLDRFGHALTKVDVRIADVNGPRGGIDKSCRIRAVLTDGPPVEACELDSHVYAAVARAARRFGEACARGLEKARRTRPVRSRR